MPFYLVKIEGSVHVEAEGPEQAMDLVESGKSRVLLVCIRCPEAGVGRLANISKIRWEPETG
jgi:hypothetical protein